MLMECMGFENSWSKSAKHHYVYFTRVEEHTNFATNAYRLYIKRLAIVAPHSKISKASEKKIAWSTSHKGLQDSLTILANDIAFPSCLHLNACFKTRHGLKTWNQVENLLSYSLLGEREEYEQQKEAMHTLMPMMWPLLLAECLQTHFLTEWKSLSATHTTWLFCCFHRSFCFLFLSLSLD